MVKAIVWVLEESPVMPSVWPKVVIGSDPTLTVVPVG